MESQEIDQHFKDRKEGRYYDLTKYFATTSLTILGVVITLYQAKWIKVSDIQTMYYWIIGLLSLNFVTTLYTVLYITNNGLTKKIQWFVIFNACVLVATVGVSLLTFAKVT